MNDSKPKFLKPRDKINKVADRDGIYITVSPAGAISFRLDDRMNGRRESLALGRQGPNGVTLRRLGACTAGLQQLELTDLRHPGRLRGNSRAENSHPPIRRRARKMQEVKSQASAQRFLTTQAAICNTFCTEPHPIRRQSLRPFDGQARRFWNEAVAA